MAVITDRTVLVTGASRGIGRALVEEALNRGARRVYAGTRGPLTHPDERVTPLALDVTDAVQIRHAVAAVGELDVLVNNAGFAQYDDLTERAAIQRHLDVNFHGLHDVTRAFVPLLARSGGAVVNNLSVNALAPLPLIASYSISKAAAFSLTQSLRTLLAEQGVSVHAVLTGLVDTDMTRGLDVPKADPADVARAVLDGVEKGEEDIFPDPMSQAMAASWNSGAAKDLERRYAALARAQRAAP